MRILAESTACPCEEEFWVEGGQATEQRASEEQRAVQNTGIQEDLILLVKGRYLVTSRGQGHRHPPAHADLEVAGVPSAVPAEVPAVPRPAVSMSAAAAVRITQTAQCRCGRSLGETLAARLRAFFPAIFRIVSAAATAEELTVFHEADVHQARVGRVEDGPVLSELGSRGRCDREGEFLSWV